MSKGVNMKVVEWMIDELGFDLVFEGENVYILNARQECGITMQCVDKLVGKGVEIVACLQHQIIIKK